MSDEHNESGEDMTSATSYAVAIRAPVVEWLPVTGRGGITFSSTQNPKLIIHTTETPFSWYPSYPYPPHLTINLLSSEKIWQHVTLSKGAYALRSADRSPNWECGPTYQVEHLGYAKDTADQPQVWYDNLARECVWFNRNKGVPLVFVPVWEGGAAYGDWSGRMSAEEFTEFSGICGHQHVHSPNSHWDPGKLDIPRLWNSIEAWIEATEPDYEEEEMVLVEGATGNAVKSMQRAMNNWSSANNKGWSVEVDGSWGKGSAMTDRLKEFQSSLSLEKTGKLDGLTASYLVGRYDPPKL